MRYRCPQCGAIDDHRWRDNFGTCNKCGHRQKVFAEENPPSQNPSLPRQAWNLATSLAAFVADGFRTVTKEEYELRLSICDACPERAGARCRRCGCNLAVKARGRAFQCPLEKWPACADSTQKNV